MSSPDIDHIRKKLQGIRLNCIREKLRERGISQKWVAGKLKKTPNTINGWCMNKTQPHLADLYLLAVLIDCPVRDLIAEPDLRELPVP